ncbi:hypothetical protein Tcan_10196 [Toxocara canis]|uniref:Uncharacterized protein n=1 Tax=Toxocara canis TaxID=6265 RepID=A0A0B2VQW0_TOXCA|nr:hypothetical protein Tcan_10196 [Toxocara canis]
MTAEMPPGSPNGNVMPTRKETAMIEKTSLSAFTSATEGTVNHDNARYSDNVLLPADDTPEALTKSSLSLKLNKCNNRNLTGFRVCSSLFARLTGIHPKERLCLIGKSKEA